MLKLTGVVLDLISDPEIFKLLDCGLRGGICMISKRHGLANNNRVPGYDETKPTSHIVYYDANNLYGWAMAQPLADKNFRWLDEKDSSKIDWQAQTETQETGYFFECDLEYPQILHDSHNEYPLAPERLLLREEMISETQKKIVTCYNIPRTSLYQTKLVPNLMTKKKYAVHYLNLKFYLDLGLQLTKIHRVIAFHQSPWLAQYINLNQQLRAKATNDFEKDFFKLMNNSVYGKTCENMKKRTDIKLVTKEKKLKKLIIKPHCMSYRIFTEKLSGVQLKKVKVLINKPFYVGFSVLELSKLLMYRFHYDYIKPKYQERAQLLFTDTDSLMYEIETPDIYKDMWRDRDLFDFASYPKDSPYFDPINNKVLGETKDEALGLPIREFIGLRPKMYSFLISTDPVDPTKIKEKHVAKGIQRAVILQLRHEDYRRQLEAPLENHQTNRRIGARLHELYTFEVDKRGLCAYDDKRYMVDSIRSLAYGHYRIPHQQVDIDMHPDGPADAGMIIVPHAEFGRAKLKRKQERIVAAVNCTIKTFRTLIR